jgi:hypothetical protein
MATKPSRASKPLSENVPVPDGTRLSEVNEPLVPYIEQYKRFAKAGSEGIIDQCSTLVDAEQDLAPKYFDVFCAELKLQKDSSTFRKLKKIGQEANRLKSVADRIPSSWTTLYQLARLEAAEFDRLLVSDHLHPAMTAQELTTAISGEPKAVAHYFLRVDLDELSDGVRVEALNKIRELTANYGAKVKSSEPLKSLLEHWDKQHVIASAHEQKGL